MKKPIKPGMLCYLTRCLDPSNNGIPVTVLRKEYCDNWKKELWLVTKTQGIKGVLPPGCTQVVDGIIGVREYQLIPIDGDIDNEDNESWFLPAPPLVEKKLQPTVF